MFETQAGGLYDAEKHGTNGALQSLEHKRLATYVGDDLWRCTLAAIAYARTGILPTPPKKSRRGAPPTGRQRIHHYLRNHGQATTKELTEHFGLDGSTIRHHLKTLEHQQVIELRRIPSGAGLPYLLAVLK
jgi:DNA-binding transcriptional ArsR family regulator